MLNSYLLNEVCIKLWFAKKHISAWITKKHEFPLTIISQGNKCQCSPCVSIKPHARTINIILFQNVSQHEPKFIFTHLRYRRYKKTSKGCGRLENCSIFHDNWKEMYWDFNLIWYIADTRIKDWRTKGRELQRHLANKSRWAP